LFGVSGINPQPNKAWVVNRRESFKLKRSLGAAVPPLDRSAKRCPRGHHP
jgi:hypothetical protein